MAKRIKAKEWIKEHKKALVIGASATAAVIGAVVVAKVKGKKIEEIDIPEIGTVVDDSFSTIRISNADPAAAGGMLIDALYGLGFDPDENIDLFVEAHKTITE